MPSRSGQFVWRGNGFAWSRAQSAGVTSSGVNRERVYEDGNPAAVGTQTDIPQLTFDVESWDLSTDLEAQMLGLDPDDVDDGDALDLRDYCPLDVTSQWRETLHGTQIAGGMIVPCLYLESASYRFGVRQNAGETFSLRGDSQLVQAGAPIVQSFNKSGAGPYTLSATAKLYEEGGDDVYVTSLMWKDPAVPGSYKRLFHDIDYTDTDTTFTLDSDVATAMPSTAKLYATFFRNTTSQSVSTSVTASTAVKPSALRSKDIQLYISDGAATPTLIRWDGVQSVELTWRVTLQAEEELGNPHYLSQDFDIPDVSGNIVARPRDVANLLSKIAQATGVDPSQVTGLLADTPLAMEIRVSHPDTGARIKTLYVDDARISVPAIATRANQIVDVTFPFQSEQGDLTVYKGERAA